MQIKHFTAYKSIEIALKYTKMTKSKKTSKTCYKFDFRMEQKKKYKRFFSYAFRSLSCIRFVAVAFKSEKEVDLWREP